MDDNESLIDDIPVDDIMMLYARASGDTKKAVSLLLNTDSNHYVFAANKEKAYSSLDKLGKDEYGAFIHCVISDYLQLYGYIQFISIMCSLLLDDNAPKMIDLFIANLDVILYKLDSELDDEDSEDIEDLNDDEDSDTMAGGA